MKNKLRPAATHNAKKGQKVNDKIIVVETQDGFIEIDLSNEPELSLDISPEDIPDPKEGPKFASQIYGPDLVDYWLHGYPTDMDEESEMAHYSTLLLHQSVIFDELISSSLPNSMKSLSFLFNTCQSKHECVAALYEKLTEEKESIKDYEDHGLTKFSIGNSIARKRIKLLLRVIEPDLMLMDSASEDDYLFWQYEFSDFCEILCLLCDAKCFGKKENIKAFRIFKKIIRFKTTASEDSFKSTASSNRNNREDPLKFYNRLKDSFHAAEKTRDKKYRQDNLSKDVLINKNKQAFSKGSD